MSTPVTSAPSAPARLDDEAVHDFVWRLQRAEEFRSTPSARSSTCEPSWSRGSTGSPRVTDCR